MGREMRGRFKREGIYVYLWLIHVNNKNIELYKLNGETVYFIEGVDIGVHINELYLSKVA